MFALISTDGTVTFLPDTTGRDVMTPLAKLGAHAARPVCESKLGDSRAWVRSEARKGLKELPE